MNETFETLNKHTFEGPVEKYKLSCGRRWRATVNALFNEIECLDEVKGVDYEIVCNMPTSEWRQIVWCWLSHVGCNRPIVLPGDFTEFDYLTELCEKYNLRQFACQEFDRERSVYEIGRYLQNRNPSRILIVDYDGSLIRNFYADPILKMLRGKLIGTTVTRRALQTAESIWRKQARESGDSIIDVSKFVEEEFAGCEKQELSFRLWNILSRKEGISINGTAFFGPGVLYLWTVVVGGEFPGKTIVIEEEPGPKLALQRMGIRIKEINDIGPDYKVWIICRKFYLPVVERLARLRSGTIVIIDWVAVDDSDFNFIFQEWNIALGDGDKGLVAALGDETRIRYFRLNDAIATGGTEDAGVLSIAEIAGILATMMQCGSEGKSAFKKPDKKILANVRQLLYSGPELKSEV